jgi:formylmethanofuran dehydrogenase subunit E
MAEIISCSMCNGEHYDWNIYERNGKVICIDCLRQHYVD